MSPGQVSDHRPGKTHLRAELAVGAARGPFLAKPPEVDPARLGRLAVTREPVLEDQELDGVDRDTGVGGDPGQGAAFVEEEADEQVSGQRGSGRAAATLLSPNNRFF
ncbi:hypothetical protein ACFXKW_32120 [Streptomyces sp. NPDC059193]|uniref:hypothetical protein n=1 Tax=Streptomyces sp. NPDC059193 TaxID=3346763 RepID=UPI0036AC9F7D